MEDKSSDETSKSELSQPIQDEVVRISISKKSLRTIVIAICAVGVAIVALVLAPQVANMSKPSPLTQAVSDCALKVNSNVSLESNGKLLFLDGQGSEGSGLNIENIGCVINALRLPKSIIQRMSSTTALMGNQTAEFEGIHIEWTYHPSNGLDITFSY
jgi:hypothetical protein